MSIKVLKRAGVATPEGIVLRIGDRRACLLHLGYDRIHFGFARDVVAECTLSRASRAQRHLGFMGERCAGQMASFKPC